MKGKRVEVTPLFEKAKIDSHNIFITETKGMYPYKEKIDDNWAYYTAVGLKELNKIFEKENKNIIDIGIVGICSGVEGIAVLLIMKNTKKLIITDVDADILKGTVYNLKHAVPQSPIIFIPLVGSFCEPIEEKNYLVDFVHANIPNLPATGEEDLTKGAEKGTFLKPDLYQKYNPPLKFTQWALGAQYAYLQSAKKILRKDASVITELGGRVPISIVKDLFKECGLTFSEVIVGFKEQTEALIDFIGYSAFEKEYDVSFEFYKYEEGKSILKKNNIENPTVKISGEKIKKLLEPCKVSAQEALKLHKRGVAVGHTVHLFRGVN